MSNSNTPKNNGFKLVMTIALVLIVVIFALQNSAETMIKFWFWQGDLPLVILLLCVLQ
ncbi:MAG: LapA family protein [Bacteroidia bacterium]